jgi:hypothetical protein
MTTWRDVVEKMEKPVGHVYLVHVAILLRALNPRGHVATCINYTCPIGHVYNSHVANKTRGFI